MSFQCLKSISISLYSCLYKPIIINIMSEFEDFNFNKKILKAIYLMGWKSPTEIQLKTFTAILYQKDTII